MKKIYLLLLSVTVILFFCCGACAENFSENKNVDVKISSQTKQKIEKKTKKINSSKNKDIMVTFVELGSVNCIPCKMMQPAMAEIEKDYPNQVKVIFHDVWTEKGRPYAEQYKIRAIPTQIFLDKDGKEFFRHEGFFPKEEIAKILEKQNIKKTEVTNKNSSQKQQNNENIKPGEICK
jgi:thioredoxin 1